MVLEIHTEIMAYKSPFLPIQAANREMMDQQTDGSKDDERRRQRVGKKGKGSNRALPKISLKGNKVKAKTKTARKTTRN